VNGWNNDILWNYDAGLNLTVNSTLIERKKYRMITMSNDRNIEESPE